MTGSIVGISIPVFLTAICMVWLFGVELGWLPAFGRGDTVELPWGWDTGLLTWDGLQPPDPAVDRALARSCCRCSSA